MNASKRLEDYLESLAREAQSGDRLPTVRSLMARFGVSQSVVQRITERFKTEGRIWAETGRGTFFVGKQGTDQPLPENDVKLNSGQRSVILLRRVTSVQRGRRVLELLHDLLQKDHCRVVELSYTDNRDAIEILKNVPRFDACVLQSSFETISIEMLNTARQKTDVIVVDGAVLAGTEVDAVGIEWGSGIQLAIDRLVSQGHRSIGFVMSSHFVLATELGRIRFETSRVTEQMKGEKTVIKVPVRPHEDYETVAAEYIANSRKQEGILPFTALIVWGIENGEKFRDCLLRYHIKTPEDLSIVLLGRTDLGNEHANFFACAGFDTTLQASTLHEVITKRWKDKTREYRVKYLPIHFSDGESIGRPLGAE